MKALGEGGGYFFGKKNRPQFLKKETAFLLKAPGMEEVIFFGKKTGHFEEDLSHVNNSLPVRGHEDQITAFGLFLPINHYLLPIAFCDAWA
jgi:hypothetical protein